jgi:glycogen operon protein
MLQHWQVKNYLTITMLSVGVPLILVGDEVLRTQQRLRTAAGQC